MEELDLHYTRGDPDLGIASEGELLSEKEIISRISAVKNTVKIINLNYQHELKNIPAVIGACTLIEKLNISHTGITEVPDFIYALPNLRNLSICCTELSDFPIGVFGAQNLQRLHIRINKDWKIPSEIPSQYIQGWQNLSILSIDMYTSVPLPGNLGLLKNLKQLFLAAKYSEGDVPSLPASFENHPELKEFSIIDPFRKTRKKFNLAMTAKILSSCRKLESFKISGFSVGKEHLGFTLLPNLKILEMGHFQIEGNVFNSLTKLKNLEVLGIWGSDFKLKEIPDVFTNMKELQEFSFAGNMVTKIPPSFYGLSKLKTLAIGSTGISELDSKIGNLQNLESINIYDSILEKLPDTIFTLPRLKVLNIEENIINENEIKKIKTILADLAKKGQKIDFTFDRQGHRQNVKKLRALDNIDSINPEVYAKYCLNAVKENPFSIKYINAKKLGNKLYSELCLSAVKKDCNILEVIHPESTGKPYYFVICKEAAKSDDIANVFKLIRADLLTDNEYILICLEAALHNRSNDFISNFNTESFQKRFSREIYERVCWVAVLRKPGTAAKIKK